MTTLEAFERLLAAVQEMCEIMIEQARIIEEHNFLDEEEARLLAARRDNARGLLAEVTEGCNNVYRCECDR